MKMPSPKMKQDQKEEELERINHKCSKMKHFPLKCCTFHRALLLILLSTSNFAYHYDGETGTWREGYEGHGTTHEQMGQPHWPLAEYTPYEPSVNMSKNKTYDYMGMQHAYKVSHFILDNLMHHEPAIPPGYITIKGEDSLSLGPKVEQNDWRELVQEYWLIFFFIAFLLLIIILLPFIAVCYCCFCCCRRCSPGCPPCDRTKDLRACMICGLLLLLLTLLILVCVVLAILSSKLLDEGTGDSTRTLRQSSLDVCEYLRDVKEHIHHLFVNNYEELLTHIADILTNADDHILLDMADTSGVNALEELLRILENMPKALQIMNEIHILEMNIRFLADELRDGIRGLRRELNGIYDYAPDPDIYFMIMYPMTNWMSYGVCLHNDEMPRSSHYIEGIKDILENEYEKIPKVAVERFQNIKDVIKAAMEHISPPILRDIEFGKPIMLGHANRIINFIEAVISDIHMNSLKTTQAFEDFYDKYSTHRTVVNIVAFVLILAILAVLIFARICGCFASKSTGSIALLLAIILIFCTISFIALVGLFYFVIGVATYHGGCAPLKAKESGEIFRQLDAVIDVNRYLPKADMADATPPLRMSTAIAACRANQTIFNLLQKNYIYNVDDLLQVPLAHNDFNLEMIQVDLTDAFILNRLELIALKNISVGKLSSYHSQHYLSHICKQFTPLPLPHIAKYISQAVHNLHNNKGRLQIARIQLMTIEHRFHAYQRDFVVPLENAYDAFKAKLLALDKLILYNNHEFGHGVKLLVEAVQKAEAFIQERGRSFGSAIIKNLTEHIAEQAEDYLDMVVKKSKKEVGICDPIAYIYYRSVDVICSRLVDPINGIWLGLLPCALLLLPVLFVAHRLMCLFKKHSFRQAEPRRGQGHVHDMGHASCPICTGIPTPYVAQPTVVCSGGQESQRTWGGKSTHNNVIIFEDPPTETADDDDTDPSINKRKKD